MAKKPSSTPVKKRAVKKVARKGVVKKTARKIAPKTASAKKPAVAKPDAAKRPRAKVLKEPPSHLVVDDSDHAAVALVSAAAQSAGPHRIRKRRSAVDRLNDPLPGQEPAVSLVQRVGDAIERELEKIERLIGDSRIPRLQRADAESRARVLASLARTLKEVMRLREQERGADEDKAKAADDDAVPRDLDEFRRELSRRLEGMVGAAAPLPAGEHEPG